MTNSTVNNNTATIGDGGGLFVLTGVVVLTNSQVNGNAGYYGGGIFNNNGSASLTGSQVNNNLATGGNGGGIATPNSFAWINASWGNPEPYFRLRVRAIREWHRLALGAVTV